MSDFKKYPTLKYPFGGLTTTTVFQDIGVYIDILDRAKDDLAFYQNYQIKDGDRPDQISQKLYGNPNYHWTFFLMNDDLRLRGWPLTNREMEKKVRREYPHKVLVTRENMTGRFQVGDIVRGLNSGAHGEIVRRRPDLGQIIVRLIPNPDPGPDQSATDIISFEDDEDAESIRIVEDADGETVGAPSMKIDRVVDEYNAKHHYENADGDHVDIFPRAPFVQRFKIPISFSPTNHLYINVTADPLAGDPVAIYFNPNLSASATNPIPDAATIAGIIEAEKAILVPQFLALGYTQEAAEAAALATSATGSSPLKNFEVNTTTYTIEDTSNPADGVISTGAWLFDLNKDVTLSTFDNLDLDLTLDQANAVALLGNLLPGASILELLFVALQLIDGKKQTNLPLSLQEFNVFFTAVFGFQQANPSYQAAVVALFADIINKNLPKYSTSSANDILDNRIQAEFEYFFIVDKLVDVAGAADVSTIGTVVKYTADDYTAAAADIPAQTTTFTTLAGLTGNTVGGLTAYLVGIGSLTQAEADAYVASGITLEALIAQLAFGAALAANPPVEKTYYKVLYSDQAIQSGSSEVITIFDENSALVTSTVTDFTSKDDAYDELKAIFDEYIIDNYDKLEPALLTPVTFRERHFRDNDISRPIKVLKPEVISRFDQEFRRILGEAKAEEVIAKVASQGFSAYTAVPDPVETATTGVAPVNYVASSTGGTASALNPVAAGSGYTNVAADEGTASATSTNEGGFVQRYY